MREPKSMLPRTAISHGEGGDLGLPLFTHGGQLEPEFVENLIGRPVRGEPARLEDHREVALDGQGWCVLVPTPGEQVTGCLYRSLVAEDYRRIDSYQGVLEGLYVRSVAAVLSERSEDPEPGWIYLPTERTLRRYSVE
jgi:hypothetical protein